MPKRPTSVALAMGFLIVRPYLSIGRLLFGMQFRARPCAGNIVPIAILSLPAL